MHLCSWYLIQFGIWNIILLVGIPGTPAMLFAPHGLNSFGVAATKAILGWWLSVRRWFCSNPDLTNQLVLTCAGVSLIAHTCAFNFFCFYLLHPCTQLLSKPVIYWAGSGFLSATSYVPSTHLVQLHWVHGYSLGLWLYHALGQTNTEVEA